MHSKISFRAKGVSLFEGESSERKVRTSIVVFSLALTLTHLDVPGKATLSYITNKKNGDEASVPPARYRPARCGNPSPNLSLGDWPGYEISSHWGPLNIHSVRLASNTCQCVVVAIAVVVVVEAVLILAILTCGRVLIYLLLMCISYHFRTAWYTIQWLYER